MQVDHLAALLAASGAALSDCGTYRWALSRRWGPGPHATFIMLNPSTADASVDDPTIRRCIGFSRRFGCDALLAVNLYAIRATDPKAALTHPDPIGHDNDSWLAAAFAAATGPVVAAWGAHAQPVRASAVAAMAAPTGLHVLGLTGGGQPRHPLYLSGAAPLTAWPKRS